MDNLRTSSSREKTRPKKKKRASGGAQSWSELMTDGVQLKSYLPGRMRFLLDFPGEETLSDLLRRELQKEPSVRFASYSVRTRTVLVTFDPRQVTDLRVMEALVRGLQEYIRLHRECPVENHHHDAHVHSHAHSHSETEACPEEECDHDHSATATDSGIRKELLKLGLTGTALGYFLYRRLSGKTTSLPDSFVDLKALITIAAGYPIFRAGFKSVQKNKKATDDTLISIAVIATLFMGESLTGLSVVWLINLGRLLEAITLKRSRTAIKELMDITPTEAWLVTDTGKNAAPKRVAVQKIEKSQVIRVFLGEKIPLDGKIIRGEAVVKEAFITGEPLPKRRTKGETVYAGSILESGEVDVQVTSLVDDTVVARIIHAIENIRDTKAPIEKVGTRFAAQFVPISLGLFGVTLLLTGDMRRAITMLVIACPCAAGLATPTAVSASIGQAARRGILIKGGTHIEAGAHIDTIIFDKTGTLTTGTPTLTDFVVNPSGKKLSVDEYLRIAASSEQHTTHPLGMVLLKEAIKRELSLSPLEKHTIHPGLGIFAEVDGMEVHIGNKRFIQSLKIVIPKEIESNALKDFTAGESVLFLTIDGVLQGIFIVHDQVRPEAVQTLNRLQRLGIKRFILASGDQKIAADFIGKQLGISEIHSELLPEGKLQLVQQLKDQGFHVAMVGDGVNDAQALAIADLSIAMGAGRCDVAMESADITLARNDLLLVADVVDISQKTLRTIYQNFTAAVGINMGGVAFSMFGKLTPFSAAIVHNASTIAVVMNSLRLGKQVGGVGPIKAIREVKI